MGSIVLVLLSEGIQLCQVDAAYFERNSICPSSSIRLVKIL